MSSGKEAMKSLLQAGSLEKKEIKFGQENIAELKSQMKEVLEEEYAEFKSGIRPSIAYKIYPWRRYLNKVFEAEVPDYKHSSIDEESLPPFDPIAAMITVFYDPDKPSNVNNFVDYSRVSSVRCVNGIFKVHKPPLQAHEEKSPYFPLMKPSKTSNSYDGKRGYALNWPFVDEGCGHSIYGKST